MKKFLLAASAATAAIVATTATPANAAIVINWFPGVSVSSAVPGGSIVYNFDTTVPAISGSGWLVQSGSNSSGANIPLSDSTGTKYLTVTAGGSATISLPSVLAHGFAFEWGSLDAYNTLIITTSDGSQIIVPGQSVLNSLGAGSNGDQHASNTNGTVMITNSNPAEVFTALTFQSSQNSFEVDNIASVPEPTTWALMVAGIAAVGFSMRRRSKNVSVAFS